MILKVNDSGDVVLPAELIQAPPQTAVEAERSGEAVILRLAGVEKRGSRRGLLDLPTIPTGPVDPAMNFRREDIYGVDGR
jgi:hypothetical protein